MFGGGSPATALSSIALVAMLIAIALVFALPRKYVIVPVLLIIFLIPLLESMYAVGVHWLVCRIIILSGLLRVTIMKVTSHKSLLADGFNSVDRAFLACMLCQSVAFILTYMESAALINQFGFLVDFVGAYFLVRALIQDEADIYRALKWIAFITLLMAVGMIGEQLTLQNIFGVLVGGTRVMPEIREGKIRSQGPFQHSLTAGTFAATLLPLFFLLWKNGKAKAAATMGLAGCTVMTICSNSSTPLLAYVAALLGVCTWPIRKNMRTVRRAIVVALVALHIVMKAPVWFIIARIDLTGGSSGYHRAELVDQFIRHFSDWWLIGKGNTDWGFDMWDTQNQYVNVGETGGLVAFILFIIMISRTYGKIGTARKLVAGRKQEWFLWFCGAALFSHLVAFFGVNYFDQSKVGWFVLLAIISAVTAPILQKTVPKDLEARNESATTPFAFSLPSQSGFD